MPTTAKTPPIRARLSALTGAELRERLRAVRWTPSDFARFCGTTQPTMSTYVSGKADGRIPMPIERCLMLVEYLPEAMLVLPEVQTPVRQSRARRLAAWHQLDRAPHPTGWDPVGSNV